MRKLHRQSVVRFSNSRSAAGQINLYLPDGSLYKSQERSFSDVPAQTEVASSLALDTPSGCRHLEVIRDSYNPDHLVFLDWQDGNAAILPRVEYDGKFYTPAIPDGDLIAKLTIPSGVKPVGDLLPDIRSTIARFVDVSEDSVPQIESFLLADWFPDLTAEVPYLAIIGPHGSGKTQLLRLMKCFCRRAFLVGDIRPAALYQLVDSLDTTLLIDELEIRGSNSNSELLRILRTGSTRGTEVVRNGHCYSTFGFKVIASRHLPTDAALASRFVTISILPTRKQYPALTQDDMRSIIDEFQPRLLMYRLAHYSEVRDFQMQPVDPADMTPRGRQLARVLTAPLLGNPQVEADLLAKLRDQDHQKQFDRLFEPEWLVAHALFALCHEALPLGARNVSIYVGGIADDVNKKLEQDGEDLRLTARHVGSVLKSLGFKTEHIGNRGRGLYTGKGFQREVHELARRLGIDRALLASSLAIERGYGGKPCLLCEQYGLTAGLRYVELARKGRKRVGPRREPLFPPDWLDSADEPSPDNPNGNNGLGPKLN